MRSRLLKMLASEPKTQTKWGGVQYFNDNENMGGKTWEKTCFMKQ